LSDILRALVAGNVVRMIIEKSKPYTVGDTLNTHVAAMLGKTKEILHPKPFFLLSWAFLIFSCLESIPDHLFFITSLL